LRDVNSIDTLYEIWLAFGWSFLFVLSDVLESNAGDSCQRKPINDVDGEQRRHRRLTNCSAPRWIPRRSPIILTLLARVDRQLYETKMRPGEQAQRVSRWGNAR